MRVMPAPQMRNERIFNLIKERKRAHTERNPQNIKRKEVIINLCSFEISFDVDQGLK